MPNRLLTIMAVLLFASLLAGQTRYLYKHENGMFPVQQKQKWGLRMLLARL
jgi:hypothetical protein